MKVNSNNINEKKIKHTKAVKSKGASLMVSFGSEIISCPRDHRKHVNSPSHGSDTFKETLARAEEQIRLHWKDFVMTGMYLRFIKDVQLYQNTHRSFDAYFNDLVTELEEQRKQALGKTGSSETSGAAFEVAQAYLKNKKDRNN